MTRLQQLLADVLASQAEAAAEDCGADAWSAVTAGVITQAEYYEALKADLEEEDAHHWQAYCEGEEERGREERRQEAEDLAGYWLDRIRALVGLPPSPYRRRSK